MSLGVSVFVPEVARAPLHEVPAGPPLAVQDVALVELHVRVTDCPLVIVEGFAVSVTAAGAAAVTVTVACAVAFGWALSMLAQDRPKVYLPAAVGM